MNTWKDKDEFKSIFTEKVHVLFEKELQDLTPTEVYQTVAFMVRDLVSEDWIRTNEVYDRDKSKQVYYFSIEFLLGRLLQSNLIGVGMEEVCRQGLKELGWDLDAIIPEERDPGLGNGGLGRLAACFIDSLAALQLPGHGCSIRYQYGLFNQRIIDDQQVELPDAWLTDGFPWEVKKVDKAVNVRLVAMRICVRPKMDSSNVSMKIFVCPRRSVRCAHYRVPQSYCQYVALMAGRIFPRRYVSRIIVGRPSSRFPL